MRILVVDNYDSFAHNLARYFRLAGGQTDILRNDEDLISYAESKNPQGVVLSPGPKTPREAGGCLELLAALPASTPVLGVCLGHQCLAEAFGGETVRAERAMHGEAGLIRHDGDGLFKDAPQPLSVGRYHSLVSHIPDAGPLEPCAWSEEGELMAIRHKERPWFGVQFHPESVLTPQGDLLTKNFLTFIVLRQD